MYTFDPTLKYSPVLYMMIISETSLILDFCRRKKRSGACGFLPILCIILFIILLGVSSWALYEGIHNLGHVVSDVWVIAVDVRDKVCPSWRYRDNLPLPNLCINTRMHY